MTITTRIDFTLPHPEEPDLDCATNCSHCGVWADFMEYDYYGPRGDFAPIYFQKETKEYLCSPCWMSDLVWAAEHPEAQQPGGY